jgi:hypothetical protein
MKLLYRFLSAATPFLNATLILRIVLPGGTSSIDGGTGWREAEEPSSPLRLAKIGAIYHGTVRLYGL